MRRLPVLHSFQQTAGKAARAAVILVLDDPAPGKAYAICFPAIIDHEQIEIREQIGIPVEIMRSEEHTSELQSLMRISYAVFCLKKKTTYNKQYNTLNSL